MVLRALAAYNALLAVIAVPFRTATGRSPHRPTPVHLPRLVKGPAAPALPGPRLGPRSSDSPQAARQSICRGSFSRIGTGSKASCMAASGVAGTASL